MLINQGETTFNHVKFISYTGKYPNLCRGKLTLNIDGDDYTFGNNFIHKDVQFNQFWEPGGECGFTNDYTETYGSKSKWIIDVEGLPEQFRKYAVEIDMAFNENVEYGCCGGCL